MPIRLLYCALALSLMVWSCSAPADKGPGWAILPFVKVDSVNPVLEPIDQTWFACPVRGDSVRWEVKDVFNPAALVKDDRVYMFYRAEDSVGKHAGTSRIGLATSKDGLHFEREALPVLYPDNDAWKHYEWEGGCEDPRIVEGPGQTYYMTYTAYNGDKARLCIATSTDLRNWTKHGSVFEKSGNPAWKNLWSKSGSIIVQMEGTRQVAVKVKGKYFMYFGDTNLFLATSENLVDWEPVLDPHGQLKIALPPREGKFDSDLVEPGPPALLTDEGILLIYNSRNHGKKGDPSLPEGTYAAGQVLFDRDDPSAVKARMDNHFIKPDKPYEITGQVNHVCFVEGLVFFKGKWMLYYGTADSKIAVAVRQ